MGRQGPVLRRLGDVPRQGIGRRPEPDLRLAVHGLVRPADPALRRRRRHLEPGRQPVRLRRRARDPPVVRRHAAPVGVRPGLAPRALPERPRHGARRRRGRGAVSLHRRRRELARAAGLARERDRAVLAARRGRDVPAHDRRRTPRTPSASTSRSRRPGSFRSDDGGATWAPKNKGLVSGEIPDPDAEWPLRAPHRPAPVAPGHPLHAEALGRHAQRQRRRPRGPR